MIFKAVRINYRIEDRIDFCFLAEFFRLAGIYVVECLEGEDKSPYLNANCYDVVIETRGIVEQLEDNSIDFRGLKQEITDMINIRKWNCLQQASVLSKLIGHIYESLLGNNIVSLSWQKIINIYVSEELVLHSMNLQYFFKKTSSPVDNAKAAYMKACQKLSNEEKEILEEEEKRYYRYAICSCKVKVNSACYFMGNDVAFPIEQLGDECIKYIHEYPDFSNFKVLLGLC